MSHGLARWSTSGNRIPVSRGSAMIVNDRKLLGQFSTGDDRSSCSEAYAATSDGITGEKKHGIHRVLFSSLPRRASTYYFHVLVVPKNRETRSPTSVSRSGSNKVADKSEFLTPCAGADHNERPTPWCDNSSLSLPFELVWYDGSLDRNDWEMNLLFLFCLGRARIYLRLRKCCNLGQNVPSTLIGWHERRSQAHGKFCRP